LAKKIRIALLAAIGIGYLGADIWLYASGMSVWDKVMLDALLTKRARS
jgi:hypothetical protein